MSQFDPKMLRRVSVLYFLFFGSHGALLPYLPLFFEERGLSPTQISFLMVLLPISNLLFPPLWALVADSLASRARVLRFCLLLYAGSVVALIPQTGFWTSLVVMVVFSLFRSPLTSLTDAVAHVHLGGALERYGHVRLWGSIGFLSCSRMYGYLYDNAPQSLAIGSISLLIIAAAMASRALDTPRPNAPPKKKQIIQSARAYVLQPGILLLLMGVFIYYAAHSTFDAYFGLYMRDLGFGYEFIGTAWAIGVGVEVLLMTQSHRILGLLSPPRILVICGIVATLRWGLLSHMTHGPEILVSQMLHGVTFGLYYLGMVNQIQKHAPPAIRATAQSIALGFMSSGMIVGYLGGGHLMEHRGGQSVYIAAMWLAVLATGIFLVASHFKPEPAPLQPEPELSMDKR